MRLVRRSFLLSPVWLLPILLAAPAAQADHAPAPPVRVIEVTGTGEVRVSPDVGQLGVAIETHARTATRASSDNAARAQKVIDALKHKLGGKGTISSGGYSLEPEYRPTRPGETMATPEIIGYVARNSVMLETPDIRLLGGLIDAAVAAGSNRIDFVSFSLRDDVKARTEAITKASRDAQAQAQALAESLGVKLKRVIKASPSPPQRIVPMMRSSFAQAAVIGQPTPIEPGQMTVSVTVSLTYEIE